MSEATISAAAMGSAKSSAKSMAKSAVKSRAIKTLRRNARGLRYVRMAQTSTSAGQSNTINAKAVVRDESEHSQGQTAQVSHKAKHIRSWGDWMALILLIVGALIMLFPIIILTMNAFKTIGDYNATGPLSLPAHPTMSGIVGFWKMSDFPVKLGNSLLISLIVAVLGVVLSVLNSFALGIGKVKGNRWIILAIMLANMMPQEALLFPLYTMFKHIGLYNTQWAIVVIFTIIQSAYGTYLLSSVYGTFPQAILEAATLDGATRWETLLKVVLPISWSTISVLFVFFFVWTWNEYMIPMAFLMDDNVQTVPLALATLQGQHTMDATTLAAASLLSIIPTIIFFIIFQRKLNQGIVAGAVK